MISEIYRLYLIIMILLLWYKYIGYIFIRLFIRLINNRSQKFLRPFNYCKICHFIKIIWNKKFSQSKND